MKLAFINNIKICKRKMLVLLCTLPVSLQIHACILCNIVDKILKTQAKKFLFCLLSRQLIINAIIHLPLSF